MPDGRYRPKESLRTNVSEPISAPDDDLVSALANTPSTIDETTDAAPLELTQDDLEKTTEPATDEAETIIVDDESLF
jgi:hypothetical protein